MEEGKDLFEMFPPATKAAWLEKIHKELRDRPWEEVQWQLTESIRLDPFFHFDDEIDSLGPLPKVQGTQNNWEIGAYISVSDSPAAANQSALEALTGGAEALLFLCGNRALSKDGLEELLRTVEPSMISLHFEFGTLQALDDSRPALRAIPEWRGSCYVAGSVGKAPGWASGWSEAVRTLVVDGRPFYRGIANTPAELADLLSEGKRYFEGLPREVSPGQANARTKLLLAVDTSYFLSIAKIRALRILWANFVNAYGADPQVLPEVEIHFTPYAPDSDPNANMIRAATQALSAAIGGADRLFVRPADEGQGMPSADTRRIARNVQHLLKMESYIDRVIDPAAGSYYIEKLTDVLAEEAWKTFTDR